MGNIRYLYDSNGLYTQEYLAPQSPHDAADICVEPDNATTIAPPALSANQAAQFVSGAWTIVPDFRGQTWFDQTTGEPTLIKTAGTPAANLGATQSSAYLAAQIKLAFKASAQAALSRSDTTVIRCSENVLPVPAEWATYRKALRAIANGSDTASTVLPTAPSYPAGT